jgi:hypothetical protein
MTRTLDIDWADLEIAFRDAGTESYLDLEGGEVLSIVDGFDDERDLRERLARFPGRFARIVPVDRSFTAAVVTRFIAAQKGAQKKKLADAFDGPGGLSRVMSTLRDDKAVMSAFARMEQAELLKTIETWLAQQNVRSADAAPGLELFEGLA